MAGGRQPPYAWTLALVFALLDGKAIITGEHMGAALAWLDCCRVSVMRIFSTATNQADAEAAGALVHRISRPGLQRLRSQLLSENPHFSRGRRSLGIRGCRRLIPVPRGAAPALAFLL